MKRIGAFMAGAATLAFIGFGAPAVQAGTVQAGTVHAGTYSHPRARPGVHSDSYVVTCIDDNQSECIYGATTIPTLQPEGDDAIQWNCVADPYDTSSCAVHSQGTPWPFADGSGLNAKYDGDYVYQLKSQDSGECIQANYSDLQTFIGTCNTSILAQLFVATQLTSPMQLASVGQDYNESASSSGAWYNLNVECDTVGCKLWTNPADLGDQDWVYGG
jgi:hypothetical protein